LTNKRMNKAVCKYVLYFLTSWLCTNFLMYIMYIIEDSIENHENTNSFLFISDLIEKHYIGLTYLSWIVVWLMKVKIIYYSSIKNWGKHVPWMLYVRHCNLTCRRLEILGVWIVLGSKSMEPSFDSLNQSRLELTKHNC